MTKTTRFGPTIARMRTGTLGYDPGEQPTGEVPDPVDYLSDEDARAWYPVSGSGSTTLVQDKTYLPGPAAAVNFPVEFDDPVTAGNLLVMFVVARSNNGSTFAGPGDWSEGNVIDANGTNGGSAAIFTKIADGTEGTGPFTFNRGGGVQGRIVLAEFSGPNQLVDTAEVDAHGAASSYDIGPASPTVGEPSLFIVGALNGSAGSITGVTGYTTISQGKVEGGVNGPSSILAYRADASPSGDETATVTQDSGNECAGDLWAFSDIADPIWVPAPLTVDGDDATYHEITGHTECWRGQLTDSFQVGRARLVIGCENSGSKSYALEGQTLDDIDAGTGTEIGTFDFTATGSFTADEIEISISGADGYEFYRLVGPSENRRIYTMELYAPSGSGEEPTADAHIADTTDAHDASAISVLPAVDGETDVQGALENHETRIDTLEAGADIEASEVEYINAGSGLSSDDVQEAIDELAAALDWSVDSVGSLTAGGSPVAVVSGTDHNAFPGLARLDASRVLLVFSGQGTSHLAGHSIVGMIGTLSADRQSVASWGSEFVILDEADDLRVEDGVSIVDDQIVIAFRRYDGTDNHDPAIIICDDAPADFTSASTWGSPILLGLSAGADQNYTQGHVHKRADGGYILGAGHDTGGTHQVGVWRWTGSVGNIAAGSYTTVASGANDYAEIALGVQPNGDIYAHFNRATGAGSHYRSASTDNGATWSAAASLLSGVGYPMFRQLSSDIFLTVYRDAPDGDTAWREDTGGTDTAYGSETILDTTGTRSVYATLLQLTPTKILCVYAVEGAGSPATDGDIYSQIFTDSSTFGANIASSDELAKVSSNDTTAGYLNGKLVAGSGITLTENNNGSNETLTIAVSSAVSAATLQSMGVRGELVIKDGATNPPAYADIVTNDDGTDFAYADLVDV